MSDSDIDRKEVKEMPEEVQADLNADPITGEPGSHPVETGIAGTGGAVIGAAIGAIGGPLGMVIGGAMGAMAGGLAGSAAGEAIDPVGRERGGRLPGLGRRAGAREQAERGCDQQRAG